MLSYTEETRGEKQKEVEEEIRGGIRVKKGRILGEVQGKIRMKKHQRSENDFQTATDLLILARGCFIMLHSRLFVRGKTW